MSVEKICVKDVSMIFFFLLCFKTKECIKVLTRFFSSQFEVLFDTILCGMFLVLFLALSRQPFY